MTTEQAAALKDSIVWQARKDGMHPQRAKALAAAILGWHSRLDGHTTLLEDAKQAVVEANDTIAQLHKLPDGPGETELERLRRENTRLRALVAEKEKR